MNILAIPMLFLLLLALLSLEENRKKIRVWTNRYDQ